MSENMMSTPVESALAVLVPAAETLVEPFRNRYDPSAAVGVPAHVTVLYPFKPPTEITADVIGQLEELFSNIRYFECAFRESRLLPRVLYLAPVPDAPFKKMTEAVSERFPETPPYAGQFADIIPHLTVAQEDDPERLTAIVAEFDKAARHALPIEAIVSEIVLLDNESGRWQVRHRFYLREV